MQTKETQICAAECMQILENGKMFVEAVKDPQTGVIHVYVYPQDGKEIVLHNYL